MSVKRVAYLTPLYFDQASYLGGGERYPLNLAKAVTGTSEYAVDIVSYGDVTAITDLPLEKGIRLRVLPTAERRRGDRLSWDVLTTIRDVDLVHLHQVFSRPSEVGMLASKLLGRPVCVTDHGGASSAVGRSLGILELADSVTCYSEFGRGLLETRTEVTMIKGGVDDVFFHPPETAPERDRVVFVGRLMPHKGIDRLISALPSNVALSVCGQPHDPGYFRVLQSLARGRQVDFLTDLDDERLRELYQRAIAVVLPSVYEDFYGNIQPWPELMGLSLLEGNACGAPSICSRVGGMPEFVDHCVTGFIFDSLDELSDRLSELASSPELVERMGATARRTVTERFGLKPTGRSMRTLYGRLLAEAG